MQDFSMPFPFETEPEIRRRLTDEQLMASPVDMYLYSLSLRGKLPENLHQAMLMWSFDPKQNEHVQEYLKWIALCDERRTFRERMNKSFERNERIIKTSMLILGIMLSILFIKGLIR